MNIFNPLVHNLREFSHKAAAGPWRFSGKLGFFTLNPQQGL